jgi:hypothetical protein
VGETSSQDSTELKQALCSLELNAADAARLNTLVERKLERQERDLRAGIERGLGLVPSMLRGAVRRLLGL